jgi:hypothetical protein
MTSLSITGVAAIHFPYVLQQFQRQSAIFFHDVDDG